jgi:hypothetical protein
VGLLTQHSVGTQWQLVSQLPCILGEQQLAAVLEQQDNGQLLKVWQTRCVVTDISSHAVSGTNCMPVWQHEDLGWACMVLVADGPQRQLVGCWGWLVVLTPCRVGSTAVRKQGDLWHGVCHIPICAFHHPFQHGMLLEELGGSASAVSCWLACM